jgi:hypothetical protein
MFDPSMFSNESVTFQEDWTDNRFRLEYIPNTRAVGKIISLAHPKEWQSPDGKTVMGLSVTLKSDNPQGITASTYINSQPRPFGNKASGIEDLIQASGLEYEGELTNRKLAELIQEIYHTQVPVGFQITWTGFCGSMFEKTLMELTETDNIDDAKQIMSTRPDIKKKANKAAEFKHDAFKQADGSYNSSTTCPETGQTVNARYAVQTIIKASDVDELLSKVNGLSS